MKRTLLLLLCVVITLSVFAQHTPLVKYDLLPTEYEELYYQYVKDFMVKKLPSNQGHYFGQISPETQLEGYAIYEGLQGGTLIGKYFQGTLLFGITMTTEVINIGSKTFYASYNPSTCELIGVMKNNIFTRTTPQQAKEYTYAQLTYANGDRYVGEIWNGMRHGFGVYYFKNGGFWYGAFDNNQQKGYGALFGADGKLSIQKF